MVVYFYKSAKLITDLVIYSPHNIRRTRDVISDLKKWIEEVALLCVVDSDLADLRDQGFIAGLLEFLKKIRERVVFLGKCLEWMTRNLLKSCGLFLFI